MEETLTLSIPEAAKALGVSASHAYELARRDELPVPVITLGRRRVVSKAALTRLLGTGETMSTQSRFEVTVQLEVAAVPA